MEINLKYRNLPNQYDLLMLDIISIKRLKAKYAHVSATVQVVRPILNTQRKASQIRKDKTYLPYLQSQITHIFTFFMFKY
jgi:hypothetical protein